MQYALEERIGNPNLFCGREKEMSLLLEWVSFIPKKLSKSKAILGRRKSGKTAIMQRLFNILWNQNGEVIPFYFEVLDENQWLLDFVESYFYTFLTQYFSFVFREPLPLHSRYWNWRQLLEMATKHENKYIVNEMQEFKSYVDNEQIDHAKKLAFSAPAGFAGYTGKFFLVMIDEIQYMTEYIYKDKEEAVKAHNLPGAYHGLVELKFAPMLVAGSYIGWMTQMMQKMFVGSRLRPFPISPKLDFKGGLEAVYKYAEYYDIDLTEEIALVINEIIQSDPYYMTSLFSSPFRDFSSFEGVIQTFINEISNKKGELYLTWLEYINISVKKVNDIYGKQILLFLSKNRYKEMGRDEILKQLNWSEERDPELEEKLLALEYGGLIQSTSSNYHYQGIPDDILDLIFRERYQYEIYKQKFDMKSELQNKVLSLEKNNRSLKSQVNELKGRMLELVVWREMNQYRKKAMPIPDFINKCREMPEKLMNNPIFVKIQSMKIGIIYLNYFIQTPETKALELDLFIECMTDDHSYMALVFEIKNRDEQKPTQKEVQDFVTKIEVLHYSLQRQDKQNIHICPIYLSANGFDNIEENWLHDNNVITADIDSWGIKIITSD